jgi:hypothetical protein
LEKEIFANRLSQLLFPYPVFQVLLVSWRAHVLGTFHWLVSDGALRDDPRYGPDRGRSLDEAAAADGCRALLAIHMDAHLRRGLGSPLHLLQIVIWGFFYAWSHGMPDLRSAFYFSAVTYTTTGYGDLVLPKEWRLVGGIEALTGILMCGLTAGLFFASSPKSLA